MQAASLYHIVFEDGTELHGLTFDESKKAMEDSEESGNKWTRVYCEPRKYKPV